MREFTVPAFENPTPRPAAARPAMAQTMPPQGYWQPGYPVPGGYPGPNNAWGYPSPGPHPPAAMPMMPGRPEGDHWVPGTRTEQEPPVPQPVKKLTPEEEDIERHVAEFRTLLKNPQFRKLLDKVPLDQLGAALNNPNLQNLLNTVPMDKLQGVLADPSKAKGLLATAAEDMVTPYVPKILRRPFHSLFTKVTQA